MKTILTEELIKEICDLVSDGNNIKDAAVMNGIPEGTFWNWMKIADENRKSEDLTEYHKLCIKLSDEMKIARARNKDEHIQNINRAAKNGTWQASAWYLERVYKNEFSLKQEVEHSGNLPVTITVKGVESGNSSTE